MDNLLGPVLKNKSQIIKQKNLNWEASTNLPRETSPRLVLQDLLMNG
jgi:hypothetical protein